ncbi:hypothetical protein PC117_g23935 [Phytophthora cactorum]|nr:hypothetical protein PC117_g23935 [Phytophthora cactorum]KAG2998459.1 hypothetical protein PC120_g21151 [Phytophthora cactorum]
MSIDLERLDDQSHLMPEQAADATAPSLDEVEVEQDRVAGEGDGGYIESNEEEAVIERNLVVLEDHVPTVRDNFEFVVEMDPGAQNERRFLARHSSRHCRNDGEDIFARVFPPLVPIWTRAS